MKKKLLIAVAILAALGLGAFIVIKSMYAKAERNVANEEAVSVDAAALSSAFSSNEASANTQYLNKTVAVTGVVNSIDTIDATTTQVHFDGVQALFKTSHGIGVGDTVSIKGIVTGLVNEVGITESILTSSKKFVAPVVAPNTKPQVESKPTTIDTATKAKAAILTTNKAQITFDAGGGVEDIKATNQQVFSSLSPEGKLSFKAGMLGFKFADALMQQHFNEEYIESKKYPTATFEGQLAKPIDLTKDGTYNVDVTGKLSMHGESKNLTTKGSITVKGGKVNCEAKFDIALKDFKVKAAAADDAKITVKATF